MKTSFIWESVINLWCCRLRRWGTRSYVDNITIFWVAHHIPRSSSQAIDLTSYDTINSISHSVLHLHSCSVIWSNLSKRCVWSTLINLKIVICYKRTEITKRWIHFYVDWVICRWNKSWLRWFRWSICCQNECKRWEATPSILVFGPVSESIRNTLFWLEFGWES